MKADAQLVAAWGNGDADAGTELIERHFSAVFRFFATKLPDEVDELVQRTFEACLQARASYRGESSFRAWLLGVARIQLLRWLQRDKPRLPEAFDPSRTTILRALGSGSLGAELATREEQRLLLAALRSIPLDLQITIELHYWEELTTEEIGLVLEIPAGTVKSRLHRARALLRDALGEQQAAPQLLQETVSQLDHWAASLRERLGSRT